MPLVDHIQKGLLKFNEQDFVLLNFSFRGDIFTDGKLVESDVEFIGDYGITGYLEIIANVNVLFPRTHDKHFVIYKIVGNDDKFNYSVEKVIFTTYQLWFDNGKYRACYKGSIKSELLIKAHELKNIDKVVCDCIAGSIPSLNDGLNIWGRTVSFNKNRTYRNNSFFKNISKYPWMYFSICSNYSHRLSR